MRNPFKTLSFQVTFFTTFIMISAVLIGLLGITSYFITNREVVDQTISSRRLLLNEINKQLEQQMQAVEYDSLVIASNPRVINHLQLNPYSFERVAQNADIIDMISRLSYVKESIHSIQLYGKNTTENSIVGANGIFDYRILERSSWFSQIKDADYCWVGTHAIEVGSLPEGDRQVISFARKVLSPNTGKEVGTLVINLKLTFMQNMISGSTADASRYILDTNRRLIVGMDKQPQSGPSFEQIKGFLDGILDNASSNFAVAKLHEKELLIWTKQDRTQWIAMDIIPWEDVTRGSESIKKVILYAAILCIVLAVCMAYLLSKQFVDPIRKLIRAMNLLKTGKLDVRVSNDYHNEFGHLNENFNQMTVRIEQLIGELDEQNRRKREAELQMLQEQINPHFIYNTLDIMNWHAIESGASDISRMLSLLGKMLRLSLSGGSSFITVQREVEHLKCYVELQKIRYKNKIHISFDVPESIYGFYIPKLIIQPFVENALIHGFHSRDEGIIDVSAWEDDHAIYWSISDNGHGIDVSASFPARGHNGIRNVHERIQLYFGESYGVQIQSEPESGMVVNLSMPKVMSEPADARRGKAHDQGSHH